MRRGIRDEALTIESIRYAAEKFVSQQIISQVTLERQDMVDLRGVAIRAIREVAAFRPPETLVVRWPATWWQHFKLRFFSKRMKKTWPVLYHTETYSAAAFLPSVPVARPEWRDTMFYGWRQEV